MNNNSFSYCFTVFFLTFVLGTCSLCESAKGQESKTQFEQMRGELWSGSLPLVNLTVDISAVSKRTFVNGEIEIVDFHKRTDSLSESVKYLCQIKYRGGTSICYVKKSFSIKLVDEVGEKQDANILGIRKENSWILDAMAVDRVRMRNRVCFDVWNEMSQTPYETAYGNRNGTAGEFVEVFINGSYHGLYCMSDKIDRKLLGLKKTKTNENDTTIRGVLYKGFSPYTNINSYADADVNSPTWNNWELQYPSDLPSFDTWKPLMDLIDLNSTKTSDLTFRQQYQDYFYWENLVDYIVLIMALDVEDCLYKNTFLSVVNIKKGHKFLISPWDMDISLGGAWDGTYNDVLVSFDRITNRPPFNRLISQNIDGFMDSVKHRWLNLYSTLLLPKNIEERLDEYSNAFLTSGAWEREYAKWNGNPVPLKQSITEELEYVKDWYRRNYEFLCDKFKSKQMGILNIPETTSMGRDCLDGDEREYADGVYLMDGRKVRDSSEIEGLPSGTYIVGGRIVIVR